MKIHWHKRASAQLHQVEELRWSIMLRTTPFASPPSGIPGASQRLKPDRRSRGNTRPSPPLTFRHVSFSFCICIISVRKARFSRFDLSFFSSVPSGRCFSCTFALASSCEVWLRLSIKQAFCIRLAQTLPPQTAKATDAEFVQFG